MSEVITASLAAAALYAGLLMLMNVALQVNVIRMRRTKLIGVGDGGDKQMLRAIRAHGNFSENAPFGIGALILLALMGATPPLVHGIGALLLLGRILHAYGLSRSGGSSIGRVGGMALTFTALIIAAVTLIARALF